jgi:hypothetical protein
MDPTAGARQAWTDVPTEKSEQPQDEQNNDDSPQHEISPFDRSIKWSIGSQLVG